MYTVYVEADGEWAERSGDDFLLSVDIEPILSKMTSPQRKPEIPSKQGSESYCELTHWNAIRSEVTAALAQLVNTTYGDSLRRFTLWSPRWNSDPDGLEYLPTRALLTFLKHDLDECGADTAERYLIGFINSTYNSYFERYELYMGGLASGDMVGVLEELRANIEFWSFEGTMPSVQFEAVSADNGPEIVSSLFSPITKRLYFGPVGANSEFLEACTSSDFLPEILWGEQDCIDDLSLVRNLRVTEDGTALVPTSVAPG